MSGQGGWRLKAVPGRRLMNVDAEEPPRLRAGAAEGEGVQISQRFFWTRGSLAQTRPRPHVWPA
jgi:hypothetical protein